MRSHWKKKNLPAIGLTTARESSCALSDKPAFSKAFLSNRTAVSIFASATCALSRFDSVT